MSMIGQFLLVPDSEIDEILRSPPSIHSLLARRVYDVEAPTDFVDVDKAWHALHFVLTGSAWEGEPPLNFIVAGGAVVGDEDVGYGPARALRSPEVGVLSDALKGIEPAMLVQRFDGPKMEALEIYPGGWAEYGPREPADFEYFTGAFDELRDLVRRGAERRLGLLIWLS